MRGELLALFQCRDTILIVCLVQTTMFKECSLPMCISHKQKPKALFLAFGEGHQLDTNFRFMSQIGWLLLFGNIKH